MTRAWSAGLWVCFALTAARSSSRADEPRRVERLAVLVAYVGADYGMAVQRGRVVSPSEYLEQRERIDQARRLVPELGGAPVEVGVALEHLRTEVMNRASAEVVATRAAAVTALLRRDFGLVLTPPAAPSIARAMAIYPMACAPCHGLAGHADTEQARTLKPPPASFFDEKRMRNISPTLAFQVITFGVSDTGMASFESLPAQTRWDLAFYVTGLRKRKSNQTPQGIYP